MCSNALGTFEKAFLRRKFVFLVNLAIEYVAKVLKFLCHDIQYNAADNISYIYIYKAMPRVRRRITNEPPPRFEWHKKIKVT